MKSEGQQRNAIPRSVQVIVTNIIRDRHHGSIGRY